MNDKDRLDLFGQMMLQRATALAVLSMLDEWYREHGQRIQGMTPAEWFSAHMPAFLTRELQQIREVDPAFAALLENHMRTMRGPVSPRGTE